MPIKLLDGGCEGASRWRVGLDNIRSLWETHGATALVGFQPFLFEGFMREAGEPATERVLPPPLETPPDMERLLPIASRNGMEILGPPGPPPRH